MPTTVDEFYSDWQGTYNKTIDVVKVNHIKNSITLVYGKDSHLTDNRVLGGLFQRLGDVNYQQNTQRIGMNYLKQELSVIHWNLLLRYGGMQ